METAGTVETARANVNVLVLDLELNQPSRKIIEIGACIGNVGSGKELETFSYLIDPKEILDERIVKLTGITQGDVDRGISVREAYRSLLHFWSIRRCSDHMVTWGGGDHALLRSALAEPDDLWAFSSRHIDVKAVFQTYCWANGMKPQSGLSRSCIRMGLQFSGRKHRAKDDAINTFRIYYELVKRLRDARP